MQHMMAGEGPQPLPVLAGCWDMRLGFHPSLKQQLPMLADLPVLEAVDAQQLAELELPFALATTGHHLMKDAGLLAAAMPQGGMTEAADVYPLAPVFVRDLCGRPVHTGLVPLPAAPSVPLFPTGCRHVPHDHPAYAHLESLIWQTLRRIECAPSREDALGLAGQPDVRLRAAVARPQEYAFKLRPDTFYADGWRLPVVPRVFAVPVAPVQAQAAAEELLNRWQQRPEGQDYEAFYDANNGEIWFEELFDRGCTVIPTLEAYNGRYHIGSDYVATAVDPGHAITGLHDIVGREASEYAAGTILEVKAPGWVTATTVHPAQVVVSNGSGFVAPEAPLPQLPDLALPHARVGGKVGDVWLPTHPEHFAEPALYDWNEMGHFVQVSGPLWDPLHYVYTSTAPLLRALRKPHPVVEGAYVLPESLKLRFHPLTPLTWYDAYNERTAQQRMQDPAHPLYGSAIDMVPLMREVAPAGYHRLPWVLEYELDPAHMPALHPRHRASVYPPDVAARRMPIAVVAEPDAYRSHDAVVTEAMREVLAQAYAAPYSEAVCDINATLLPLELQRQQGEGARAVPVWLPEISASHLAVNIKRIFAARHYRQSVQEQAIRWQQPGFPAAFYQFREAALAWRRLRYRLFGKYAAVWQQAAAEGLDLAAADILVPESDPQRHTQVQKARIQGLGVVASLPLQRADGLPSAAAQGKLTQAERPKPVKASGKPITTAWNNRKWRPTNLLITSPARVRVASRKAARRRRPMPSRSSAHYPLKCRVPSLLRA
jgi:hypothetical protein